MENLTRKQRVAEKTEATVSEIVKDAYKATDLPRGLERVGEYVKILIRRKPNEKTFYERCHKLALARLVEEK